MLRAERGENKKTIIRTGSNTDGGRSGRAPGFRLSIFTADIPEVPPACFTTIFTCRRGSVSAVVIVVVAPFVS